jgi:hypothetical protein
VVPTALTRPFYGVLLAPTVVLATYGDTHTSLEHLWRPLVVLTVAALLLFGVLGLTRRWDFAALITAMAVLALVGGYEVLGILLLVAIVVSFQAIRRGSWSPFGRITQPLNVLVGLWFAMTLAIAVYVSMPADLPDDHPVAVAQGPNVYLVLLDGYQRADSLMEYFDFDNQPFLGALADRGFTVAEHSHTRYTETAQVVPTMLHRRPLEELLGGEWDASNAQYRLLQQAINRSPTQDGYEAAGYRTYSIVSGATGLDWRSADVVMESPWPSTFERHLLFSGVLRWVLPFDAMHRASVLDDFRYLKQSAGTSPRFVFAHVMSPHHPYVFNADGSPADPCEDECENHAGPPNPMLDARLSGQVTYLNELVLDAVDHIIDVDPEGIIVVFSDHGLRRDTADMGEWVRTLLAARNAPITDDAVVMDLVPDVLGGAASAGVDSTPTLP